MRMHWTRHQKRRDWDTIQIKRLRLQQVGVNVKVVGSLGKVVHQHFQLRQIPHHFAAQHCSGQRSAKKVPVILNHLAAVVRRAWQSALLLRGG